MMQFMIQDILDYAQIKAGKFRKNIAKFNVIDSVHNVVMIQQKRCDEKGIFLKTIFENISENEQLGCYSPFINTDEDRLKQVLIGLLSNAIKFTKKGGIMISVKIFDDPKIGERFVHISVQDTAAGIPREQQSKMFKMFGFHDNK